VTAKADDPRYLGVLRWTLYVIAIWSFAWTVYRAFLNVEIEPNEGWNAYFADAAIGKMPFIHLPINSSPTTIRHYPFTSLVWLGGL